MGGGRGGGRGGGSIRREFQFPGDLWLPRRENRCRQPANNHTSYHYHTPGVYTNARIPRSLSLLESPREERGRGIGARSNTFLPAHLYLIINRRDFGQVPHKEEGEKRDLERESLEIFFKRWRGKRRFRRVICFLSLLFVCVFLFILFGNR